jgi:hypothetical protein
MELVDLVMRVTIALKAILPSMFTGIKVQDSLVHLVCGMTKKDRNLVTTIALPVPSALEAQFYQYRVKPDNLAQAAMTNVRHVPLAFTALLQKKESFVNRAHIVKVMLQPVKYAKLDILVYKVLELIVHMALTKITLIKLIVRNVLLDTFARINIVIRILYHVNQVSTAMKVGAIVIYAK